MNRFLIIIRLVKGEGAYRIRQAVPAFMKSIDQASRGEFQLAFSSQSGETFGVFAKTPLPARPMRQAIEACGEFTNGDHILVMEVGDSWDATGNSRGWQWLQHH